MRAIADYLSLIPPLNAQKPKFNAVITAVVAPYADAQIFLAKLSAAFDIDVAIGAQLDVVGQWVGRSRNVTINVAQPWFSWGILRRGWGRGYWRGPPILANYISVLDDDTYRRLLYAKIIANYVDGQTSGAQAALSRYFANNFTNIFVVDVSTAAGVAVTSSWTTWPTSVGMQWQIGVTGKIPSVVDLEILSQDLIPVVPAGVFRDVKVVTVDDTPLFGWGLSNKFVSGWGQGSWGASPQFVAQNIMS